MLSKEDLVVGKWYKEIDDDFHMYFKFEKIIDNKLYCYGNYINFENRYTKLLGKNYNVTSFVFERLHIYNVEFKELVNYLPDNHPDKIAYYRKNKIETLLKI